MNTKIYYNWGGALVMLSGKPREKVSDRYDFMTVVALRAYVKLVWESYLGTFESKL